MDKTLISQQYSSDSVTKTKLSLSEMSPVTIFCSNDRLLSSFDLVVTIKFVPSESNIKDLKFEFLTIGY